MASRSGKETAETLDTEAILRGDRRAFEALVRQESPRLFRLLLRMLRDEDEARSLMQETFLQAYKGLGTFRGEAKLTSWLYAIALNLGRAALRKRKRQRLLQEQDIERLQPRFRMGMYVERYEPWPPDMVTEHKQRRQLVRQAIDELPESYRLVVILRDMEEFSTEEVARMMQLSEGAVRVRLHRGRQVLRALLKAHFR